jgi:transposase
VKQPYLAYKKNEGIKRGFKRGMKNFLVSFSSQGIFFGEKIFRGMKIVVFRKTKLSLKKKSLYKAWVYKINQKQHDYEMYYYKQK